MKNYYKLTIFILVLTMSSCDKDIFNPTPNSKSTIELSSITTETVLKNHKEGVDYIVKSPLEVRSKLIIEAGVEVQFEPDTYIYIHSNGSISAEGNASSNIIFTNTGNSVANWSGIIINSKSSLNSLNHCIIEYAGMGMSFGTFNEERSAVTLDGGSVNMNNCIIQKSGSNGFLTISSINDCTILGFQNNQFIENKKFPILVNQNYLPATNLNSCTFIENSKNMIGIKSINKPRLKIKSTWNKLPIPYFIMDGFELYKGLTIEAGTEMIFGNNAYLSVAGSSSNAPYLTLQGTQSNHIVLRGEEALIGYWQGIRIDQGNVKNIFEYADISDGGSNIDFSANIVLYNENTNLTINNCTSARSGTCDVILDDFLGTPILTNNSPEVTKVCFQ